MLKPDQMRGDFTGAAGGRHTSGTGRNPFRKIDPHRVSTTRTKAVTGTSRNLASRSPAKSPDAENAPTSPRSVLIFELHADRCFLDHVETLKILKLSSTLLL